MHLFIFYSPRLIARFLCTLYVASVSSFGGSLSSSVWKRARRGKLRANKRNKISFYDAKTRLKAFCACRNVHRTHGGILSTCINVARILKTIKTTLQIVYMQTQTRNSTEVEEYRILLLSTILI